MNGEECTNVILDQAKKYLEAKNPDFRLMKGRKVYTKDQIVASLDRDPSFRDWFVNNVLRLSTELMLRGTH